MIDPASIPNQAEVSVWTGRIVEFHRGVVTAALVRDADPARCEFYADFDLADLRREHHPQLGDLVKLWVPAGAPREDCLLAQITLPPWTESELVEICRYARETAAILSEMSD